MGISNQPKLTSKQVKLPRAIVVGEEVGADNAVQNKQASGCCDAEHQEKVQGTQGGEEAT
jgi:hypothetical protein